MILFRRLQPRLTGDRPTRPAAKADEAARAGAQAELLRARIDQQAVEARLKESEVADRVRRLARLNGELEEALNRRNAAMNAMFSAWLPASRAAVERPVAGGQGSM